MSVYGAGSRCLGRSEKKTEWLQVHVPQAPGNSHCTPTATVNYLVDVFDGASGSLVGTLGPYALAGGQWMQIDGVLSRVGVTSGYARVRTASVSSDYAVYGVLNDGASPGQGTSDGSYATMRVPLGTEA